MHPAAELLRELERELRALLARVSDGGWREPWSRCRALFARYEADPPALDALPPGERAEVEAAAADVLRLNAVAVGMIGREHEKVSHAIAGIASSRRRVRGQSDEADTAGTGRSCDVRG